MTKRKSKWVLVLDSRSPLGTDYSCVVGPFDSEEKAREYANSDTCDHDGNLGMRAMLSLRPVLNRHCYAPARPCQNTSSGRAKSTFAPDARCHHINTGRVGALSLLCECCTRRTALYRRSDELSDAELVRGVKDFLTEYRFSPPLPSRDVILREAGRIPR
jgi:hypothetical protein